jgi:hypothetical protein
MRLRNAVMRYCQLKKTSYIILFTFVLQASFAKKRLGGAYRHSIDPIKKKGQDIPVIGRGGPEGCETSGLRHFLHNRLADDGEVVSLTLRPLISPQEGSHILNRF